MYGIYFQAHVPPASCLWVIGILKSYEHVAFARTLDINQSIVEFFVTEETKESFLAIMHMLSCQNMVFDLKEMPNRLLQEPL
ncbi:hypothetical protein EKK58_03620 [Candidatus Dependentiae bacterium]|nr:MAG: hypothetical protein EKK58_03620 [Candidatus Dependentiae bacterium]